MHLIKVTYLEKVSAFICILYDMPSYASTMIYRYDGDNVIFRITCDIYIFLNRYIGKTSQKVNKDIMIRKKHLYSRVSHMGFIFGKSQKKKKQYDLNIFLGYHKPMGQTHTYISWKLIRSIFSPF